MHDVPEPVLLAGGERGPQCGVRLLADEGEPAEDDADAAGADVLLDDRREGVARPLGAIGALQVGVLDEGDGRLAGCRARSRPAGCRGRARRARPARRTPAGGPSPRSCRCCCRSGSPRPARPRRRRRRPARRRADGSVRRRRFLPAGREAPSAPPARRSARAGRPWSSPIRGSGAAVSAADHDQIGFVAPAPSPPAASAGSPLVSW